MSNKYNSLEELRRKKALLKKEVSEMEGLLTFENTKESLSAFTGGLTDKYLKQNTDENGEAKLSLNTGVIMKEVAGNLKEKVTSKNTYLGIAHSAVEGNFIDSAIKLGSAAFIGNFAKKNLNHSSWKKKLIGLALIYLLPFALRFLRKKIEEYQKKKSVSSMEKLI